MSEPFLGEIRIFAFDYAPRGWAYCNGQFLAINQNAALFSLLGTMYGGNGITTFALPDLQGRIPHHMGGGLTQGQQGGQESHTLVASEIPSHTHSVTLKADAGTATLTTDPTGNVMAPVTLGASTLKVYSDQAPNTHGPLSSSQMAGSGQAHPNLPPYLVLGFCIALQGIFPSRN